MCVFSVRLASCGDRTGRAFRSTNKEPLFNMLPKRVEKQLSLHDDAEHTSPHAFIQKLHIDVLLSVIGISVNHANTVKPCENASDN